MNSVYKATGQAVPALAGQRSGEDQTAQAEVKKDVVKDARPIDDWIERLDRGEQLGLRADGRDDTLYVVRRADLYVMEDSVSYWTQPCDDEARLKLRERLASYWPGERVSAAWQSYATAPPDLLEGTEPSPLLFSGVGSGGSWTVEFVCQPNGDYIKTTTLNNDWDPLGSANPEVTTERLNAAHAREEIALERRDSKKRQ